MRKEELCRLLSAETKTWAEKSYDQLRAELRDVVAFQRGEGSDAHQFEVIMLEKTDDYVHVGISVDDGSFLHSFAPPTTSFIVHKDGRVEI